MVFQRWADNRCNECYTANRYLAVIEDGNEIQESTKDSLSMERRG